MSMSWRDRGGELHGVLTEATVAADADHLTVAADCGPRSHRRREGEPDRPEVARHEDVLAARDLEVPTERIGVVADVDGDHGMGIDGLGSAANTAAEPRPRGGVGLAALFLDAPEATPLGHLSSAMVAARLRASSPVSSERCHRGVARGPRRSPSGTDRWPWGRGRSGRSVCSRRCRCGSRSSHRWRQPVGLVHEP